MYLRNREGISGQGRGVRSRLLPVVVLVVLCATIGASQEARSLKNPLATDRDAVEAGKKLFSRHCASCHGPQGKGDGSMALAGGTPSNLTDDKWDHGSTDGEIFVAIRDGTSPDMEAYKEKLSEKEIWQVVTFVRSLGGKTQ